jgi:hypothetical protein
MSTTMTMPYFLNIPASESQVAKASREQGENCVTGCKKNQRPDGFFYQNSRFIKNIIVCFLNRLANKR